MSGSQHNVDPLIEEVEIEQAIRIHESPVDQEGSDDSFDTSQTSSLGNDDISEETHSWQSEHSVSMASSSSSDEAPEPDQTIRVYDARFKIPAQSNIGQLMSAKNTADLTK